MYDLGPSGVAIPFVHDRLIRSVVEGGVSYPQVPTGVVCFMAQTAVRAIVNGEYKWSNFEKFAPSDEQLTYIGTVMDRVHRRDNIPYFMEDANGGSSRVDSNRLRGAMFAFRNDSIAAVGSFTRGIMRSKNPDYYDQPGYQGRYFDARPRFVREFFNEGYGMRGRITPEVQALDMLLDGVATNLRPTNQAARRVKQELRAIYTQKPDSHNNEETTGQQDRLRSVKSALYDIITTSMIEQQAEAENILQYPLPMEAIEGFARTAIAGSR